MCVVYYVNWYTYHMRFTVYILRTDKDTLYIGQTNNINRRIKEHASKNSKSAKYMRKFTSFELVYTKAYDTRKEAMQEEHRLKQLPKVKKELLILQAI